MSADRQFDIVLFGASGFTGKHVVAELASLEPGTVKWAVAGRSESKLRDVLKVNNVKASDEGGSVGLFVADVENTEALDAMCKSTRLVVTVVGPFRKFGESLVAACVRNKTDCVDICGEPEFLERVQLKYDAEAREAGCLVVQSCGLDSIPADFGCQQAAKWFSPEGVMTHADTFLDFQAEKGFCLNFATFEAAVLGFGNQEQLKDLRKQYGGKRVNVTRVGKKPQMELGPFIDARIPERKCFAFPGADASVIRRTQEVAFKEANDYVGFHIRCFFCVPDSFKSTMKTRVYGGMFKFLAGFDGGREMLLKYPEFFSGGTFSREGPTQEQIDAASFSITIFGMGYSTRELATKGGAPDKLVKVVLSGPDPGYKGTSRMLIGAALTVIKERSAMPDGGVYPPGAVLRRSTRYMDHLAGRGFSITFEELPAEDEPWQ